jgi:hypothetical protein
MPELLKEVVRLMKESLQKEAPYVSVDTTHYDGTDGIAFGHDN